MVSSSTSRESVSVGPIHARVYNSVPFTLDPIEGAKWAPCTPVPEKYAPTVSSMNATLNVSGSEVTADWYSTSTSILDTVHTKHFNSLARRHKFGEQSMVQFSEDGSQVRGLLFSGIHLSKIGDRPDYKNQADYVIVSDWTAVPESRSSQAGPKTRSTEGGREDDGEEHSDGEDTVVSCSSTIKGVK